ncbi:MAG: glycosyltransferase family 2 protein [Verrucomicrobia bacterium]|nr:glycosyltransferase family 2 protein [Verrucomicrobiota bacterium]
MVCLVIPALNEAEVIGEVVHSIPRTIVNQIIVVDNGSTDATAQTAMEAGAFVVSQPARGYGRACRAGTKAAIEAGADIVVFIDGDGSDYPEFIGDLIRPIQEDRFDFVIGSRTRGIRERGSLTRQQVFAGFLAGWLLHARYGVSFTDMSPFRAIRSELLESLPMREETYGWNLEMQMLVAQKRVRILEIPVNHRRRRGGVSKVSGTFKGTILAAFRIVATFLRVAL